MNFNIPFSGRSQSYSKEELNEVLSVMRTAETLTQGEFLKSFQSKFCKYTGVDHAFALNNGTSALELSAQLCQFNAGDEVIIPSHTYTASAYPFLKQGATIVWADIDIKTRVVTEETLEKCITSRTKAIVVVHLYGFCADMPKIIKMARRHNLVIIEDAAQALGARIENQMAGTFGDFGIVSFHSHKNITTRGEGGMLIVKSKKVAEIIPNLRHNGHCEFNFARDYYWVPAMGNVDLAELNGQILWPNNYCLGEVECALGIKLLDRIDAINNEKNKRAMYFIDEMSSFDFLVFHKEASKKHNYHLLVAQVLNGKRDLLIGKMAEAGVQCVVQYYPLNRYDLYKKAGYGYADCPNADLFFDSMISFPFQHMMKEKTFSKLIDITKSVLSKI
jgi:dTDP-4-amino-4,6-dideoxygalactose transaminase